MGWYQSGHGDIELAFKSYEEALSMGEHLEFYALNDAMVNTATLYIIHGDEEYVHKGIELLKNQLSEQKTSLRKRVELEIFRIPSSFLNLISVLLMLYTSMITKKHWSGLP